MRGIQEPLEEALEYLNNQFEQNNLSFAEEIDFIAYDIGPMKDSSTGDSPFHADSEVFQVSREDAAFLLGRGGRTKAKISRVSGASLDLRDRSNTIEIWGPDDARARAKKYIEIVQSQRVGLATIDEAIHDDGDLTVMDVPNACIGFVTGKSGIFLRNCEEEFNVMMFFCKAPGGAVDNATGKPVERMAIFGLDPKNRKGAELKVMSAVEVKYPG